LIDLLLGQISGTVEAVGAIGLVRGLGGLGLGLGDHGGLLGDLGFDQGRVQARQHLSRPDRVADIGQDGGDAIAVDLGRDGGFLAGRQVARGDQAAGDRARRQGDHRHRA
jgi:hypothetical protein